jgi:Pyridoxamine 5'-phosphate oxidase
VLGLVISYFLIIFMSVASWAEFEASEPEFASRVRALMTSRKHLTMATLRSDGSPRISGTEVKFSEGALEIGSMSNAVKAQDLRRNPRIAIHGPTDDPPEDRPTGWQGEAKVSGTAAEVDSDSSAHRFLIDIQEAVITHLNEAGTRLVVESWNSGRGYGSMERD